LLPQSESAYLKKAVFVSLVADIENYTIQIICDYY
jgi:hypothetical protein